MKQHQGIWLPDHERHMIEWMNKSGKIVNGRGTYQIRKLRAALTFVKQFRVAVDVGSHCAFWSMHLANRFDELAAFDPIADHRECWYANMAGGSMGRVALHPCALGAAPGRVALIVPPGSSGGTHISGPGDIEMRTLDSFALQDVDFIKVDCEGAELAVLQGAVDTIARCKPCIIVEQKAHIMAKNFGTAGRPAVDYLLNMGAILRREMGGDYIMSFDDGETK